MSLLQMSIPTPFRQISFSTTLFPRNPLFLRTKLSLHSKPTTSLIIRMGGGPRTFPGGVSKWQWKRMQSKKAKQLLKARLTRERQIYEMRKRAELKAAVSELERPWEVVERAPNLFSVEADEQLKVLADRFQKPGGFDMWSEKDGPQLFQSVDGLPSARFFPKGVVHSVKPYARVSDDNNEDQNSSREMRQGEVHSTNSEGRIGNASWGKGRKKRNRKNIIGSADSKREESIPRQEGSRRCNRGNGVDREEVRASQGGSRRINRDNGLEKLMNSDRDVYDMSLQRDGVMGSEGTICSSFGIHCRIEKNSL